MHIEAVYMQVCKGWTVMSTAPAGSYMMASTIWYRCLFATLVCGGPDPGEVAGVRLAGIITVCGVLLKIRLAAGNQVSPTSLSIPALVTRLITSST